ncbi:MAG TPA: hypothetical protein DDW52_30385 [Planctomycetaceae bacterium]|nr:hypothetical protein [Planctomycetaceae bacterium]
MPQFAHTVEDLVFYLVQNACYDAEHSVTKARLFVRYAAELAIRKPTSVTIDGNTSKWDHSQLLEDLARARRWLAANDPALTSRGTGGGPRYYDHSDIRR